MYIKKINFQSYLLLYRMTSYNLRFLHYISSQWTHPVCHLFKCSYSIIKKYSCKTPRRNKNNGPYWFDTIQHNILSHNTTQYNTIQHNTTQHNTTQYNTPQYNTRQHKTTQKHYTHLNIGRLLSLIQSLPQHEETRHVGMTPHNISAVQGPCPFLKFVFLTCPNELRKKEKEEGRIRVIGKRKLDWQGRKKKYELVL